MTLTPEELALVVEALEAACTRNLLDAPDSYERAQALLTRIACINGVSPFTKLWRA